MDQRPQRAGIYCRLSFAEDGSEEKVIRQEADCRVLADRLAWPVSEAHVFKDNNRSAWQRNRKRPGWDQLLAAIEAREIDAVIIYHGDRLIRQPFDLEKLINVADSLGVRIASPSGTRNLDNSDDRFILRIEAAQACKASDDTSRRVKRGVKARVAKGLPIGTGRRPFGFESDKVTHRQAETALIKEAAERLLANQSVYGVVKWLNEIGSRGTGGALWRPISFKEMITSPRMVGLRVEEGELVKAPWNPVLDAETWAAVRHMLEQRRVQAGPQDNTVRYLLSGIATCYTCGHALVVRNVRTYDRHQRPRPKYKTYHCVNTQCALRTTRSVANLDAYVVGRVLQVLNDPEFLDTLHAADTDAAWAAEIVELERRRAATKRQLENLADFPDADMESALRGLASFDKKIAVLRQRSATTGRARLLSRLAGFTREQWDGEPLDVRRSTVRALFAVIVKPTAHRGRGFDEAAVVLWPLPSD